VLRFGHRAGIAGIIAKIASIAISFSNADHYGFVAEHFVSVNIGGVADGLSAGPHNNPHPVGETSDMAVY
jgi:hypothetical protein